MSWGVRRDCKRALKRQLGRSVAANKKDISVHLENFVTGGTFKNQKNGQMFEINLPPPGRV